MATFTLLVDLVALRMEMLASLVKVASLLGLTAYFLAIAHDRVTKYLEGYTTVSKRVEDTGRPLELPAVSVCPGYKEEFTDLVWGAGHVALPQRDNAAAGAQKVPENRGGGDRAVGQSHL